ncbi:unnamed protein product, partial [Ectocarpus sp. 8 AP-2014]
RHGGGQGQREGRRERQQGRGAAALFPPAGVLRYLPEVRVASAVLPPRRLWRWAGSAKGRDSGGTGTRGGGGGGSLGGGGSSSTRSLLFFILETTPANTAAVPSPDGLGPGGQGAGRRGDAPPRPEVLPADEPEAAAGPPGPRDGQARHPPPHPGVLLRVPRGHLERGRRRRQGSRVGALARARRTVPERCRARGSPPEPSGGDRPGPRGPGDGLRRHGGK